jgi:phospholipase C
MQKMPLAASILVAMTVANPAMAAKTTSTPIKHLIVVAGENVTFDTLFGAYVPPKGQSINNLLSQKMINADGTPGAKYAKTVQSQASESGMYNLNPARTGAYTKLPQPMLTGAYNPASMQLYGNILDPRFAGLTANGVFQITKFTPYISGLGDPAHRFFQMWQQTGGNNAKLDLFTWVTAQTGTGGATDGVSQANPGQGGELMGFFNMNTGDAPFFKHLAQNYAISDNYHQFVMGGTGANFFALATGDVAVYKEAGKLAVPPLNQIENPDPTPGSNNFYTNDGYSGGSYVNCSDAAQPGVQPILNFLNTNHRRSNCQNGAYYLVNNYNPPYTVEGTPNAIGATTYTYPAQTVSTIGELLSANKVTWSWYTGGRDEADVTSDSIYTNVVYPQVYAYVNSVVPANIPSPTREAIVAANAKTAAISTTRPYLYNAIGDPLNASANVVANPSLKANLKGLASFYNDVSHSALPAVSFVVPKNLSSGHPGYSAPYAYEAFLSDLVAKVQASGQWADTAIIITTDEGGGYFDTGYIQNLDFFGDGPRIPMIVVSPYAKKNFIDHTYHDHASILKFIEHNWHLPTLSARSRDNLPNPKRSEQSPYVPANQPAIGDLTSLFNFED